MTLTLTVVTPWRNHRELERDYWAAMRTVNARVLVIDNGSHPPLPNAIRFDENLGFSKACNVGLDLARTDAVLWLNNDIRAERADWLSALQTGLEPGVLVGADLRYDRHGDVDGETFPYLDGWCLAGMRDDLLELGGFDESFMEPAYFGDNDLCFRARMSGMTLRHADVGLVHLANRTAGPADDAVVRLASQENRERFAARVREQVFV